MTVDQGLETEDGGRGFGGYANTHGYDKVQFCIRSRSFRKGPTRLWIQTPPPDHRISIRMVLAWSMFTDENRKMLSLTWNR
jgi:hypothetical protein